MRDVFAPASVAVCAVWARAAPVRAARLVAIRAPARTRMIIISRCTAAVPCNSLSRLRGLGVGVSLVEHKGDLRLDPERRRDAVARDGLDLLDPHRAQVWDRARGAPHSLPGGIVIAVGRPR